MIEFKSWRDIRNWAEEHGYKNIVKRMDLNNKCWESSGEFGRSQIAICDAIRFAKNEEELFDVAEEIEDGLCSDDLLNII